MEDESLKGPPFPSLFTLALHAVTQMPDELSGSQGTHHKHSLPPRLLLQVLDAARASGLLSSSILSVYAPSSIQEWVPEPPRPGCDMGSFLPTLVASFPSLVVLDLTGADDLTPTTALEALASLSSSLKWLSLAYGSSQWANDRHISTLLNALPNLDHLDLSGIPLFVDSTVAAHILAAMASSRAAASLKALNLAHTSIQNLSPVLELLKATPSIKTLSLAHKSLATPLLLTPGHTTTIAQALPQLQALDLSGFNYNPSEDPLAPLVACTALSSLNLSDMLPEGLSIFIDARMTGGAMWSAALSNLIQALPALTALNISGTLAGPSILPVLAAAAPSLTAASLANTPIPIPPDDPSLQSLFKPSLSLLVLPSPVHTPLPPAVNPLPTSTYINMSWPAMTQALISAASTLRQYGWLNESALGVILADMARQIRADPSLVPSLKDHPGAIEALIDLLKLAFKDRIIYPILRLIGRASSVEPTFLQNPSHIAIILSFATAYRPVLLSHALWILSNLSCDPSNASWMRLAGAIPALLNLLNTLPREARDTQLVALWTLANLAVHGPALSEFAAYNAPRTLLAILPSTSVGGSSAAHHPNTSGFPSPLDSRSPLPEPPSPRAQSTRTLISPRSTSAWSIDSATHAARALRALAVPGSPAVPLIPTDNIISALNATLSVTPVTQYLLSALIRLSKDPSWSLEDQQVPALISTLQLVLDRAETTDRHTLQWMTTLLVTSILPGHSTFAHQLAQAPQLLHNLVLTPLQEKSDHQAMINCTALLSRFALHGTSTIMEALGNMEALVPSLLAVIQAPSHAKATLNALVALEAMASHPDGVVILSTSDGALQTLKNLLVATVDSPVAEIFQTQFIIAITAVRLAISEISAELPLPNDLQNLMSCLEPVIASWSFSELRALGISPPTEHSYSFLASWLASSVPIISHVAAFWAACVTATPGGSSAVDSSLGSSPFNDLVSDTNTALRTAHYCKNVLQAIQDPSSSPPPPPPPSRPDATRDHRSSSHVQGSRLVTAVSSALNPTPPASPRNMTKSLSRSSLHDLSGSPEPKPFGFRPVLQTGSSTAATLPKSSPTRSPSKPRLQSIFSPGRSPVISPRESPRLVAPESPRLAAPGSPRWVLSPLTSPKDSPPALPVIKKSSSLTITSVPNPTLRTAPAASLFPSYPVVLCDLDYDAKAMAEAAALSWVPDALKSPILAESHPNLLSSIAARRDWVHAHQARATTLGLYSERALRAYLLLTLSQGQVATDAKLQVSTEPPIRTILHMLEDITVV